MDLWNFFSAEHYYPQGYGYLWKADVLWLHVVSDSLIFLSFMIIPCILYIRLRKMKVSSRKWIVTMIALLIASTGITHLANVITIWHPYYGVEGLLKAITAAISVATALLIIPLTSKTLKLMENFKDEDDETMGEKF